MSFHSVNKQTLLLLLLLNAISHQPCGRVRCLNGCNDMDHQKLEDVEDTESVNGRAAGTI